MSKYITKLVRLYVAMEIFGVTPVESAFEVIGLTNCKLIMDFIFKNTHLGLAAFVVGFLFHLWKSLEQGNFQRFSRFLFLFFVIWFIFIVPSSATPQMTSTMENNGFKGLSSQEIVSSEGGRQEVPSMIAFVSRFFNSIVIGTIKAVSMAVTNSEYNYLANPFLMNKVSLQMQRFAGEGIQDKALKEETASFYYNHYLPTISLMSREPHDRKDISSWWPGHIDVTAHYSSSALEEWQQLKVKLLDYVNDSQGNTWLWAQNFINSVVPSQGYPDDLSMEDRMIISLFDAEITQSAHTKNSQEVFGTSSFQQWTHTIFSKFLGEGLALTGASIWQIFAVTTSAALLKALPYVEGYACLIMYSLFPFTLLFCLLLGKAGILLQYFRYLFWVKSWVIIWALVHYASLFMADIQARVSPGVSWFWERPYFNVTTSIFLAMSPVIAMYFVEGFVQGIGQVVSAVTVHIDKAVGETEKMVH